MSRSAIVAALSALLLGSAALAAQEPAAGARELAGAGATDLLVSAEWLAERLGDPAVVVLHVGREEADYTAAHVPGARWLPLRSILTERDGVPNLLPEVEVLRNAFEAAGVSDASHVVVYGDLGGLAATRTFFTLEYLGHPHVSLLDGGLEAWRAGGHRVAAGPPAEASRGSLTPRPRPELAVTADWVHQRIEDPAYLLIDARPEAQYTGEDAAGLRAGHIPGAANVFWRTTLISEEDPRFRDLETLRAMYGAVGAAPDRTIVAYCRTGVQASHAYFTARLLGLPVVLYDGSMSDWSPRAELPVAAMEMLND